MCLWDSRESPQLHLNRRLHQCIDIDICYHILIDSDVLTDSCDKFSDFQTEKLVIFFENLKKKGPSLSSTKPNTNVCNVFDFLSDEMQLSDIN